VESIKGNITSISKTKNGALNNLVIEVENKTTYMFHTQHLERSQEIKVKRCTETFKFK
jgi:Na+-transporting NADH:ubiquinone oxidoreductase subunit NqrA